MEGRIQTRIDIGSGRMIKTIKLTHESSGTPIYINAYINADRILCMRSYDGYTGIALTSQFWVHVKETCNQIKSKIEEANECK